jgi:hypothetical protein
MPHKQIYMTDRQAQQLEALEIAQDISASSIIRQLVAEKWARLVDMGLIKVEAITNPVDADAQVVPVVSIACTHPMSKRYTSREPDGTMYHDGQGMVDKMKTVVTCKVCGAVLDD